MRFRHLALMLPVLLAACAAPVATPTPTPSTPTTPSPTTSPPVEPVRASWTDDVDVAIGNGLRLGRCDAGEAWLLCVLRDGQPIGDIALGVYPEDGLGDTATQAEVEARAADFLASFTQDRELGCAAFTFTPMPVQPSPFADGPGAVAGFTLTDDTGRVVEQVLVHVTIRDGAMWVAQADAYVASGGCLPPEDEAWEFTPADLEAVAPTLTAVVAGTPLPAR